VSVVDIAAAAVVAIAVLRGFWIGLVRELFSIAALAAACFAVRAFTEPVGEQIATAAKINPLAGQAAGGALVAVATIIVIALIGYLIRRSVRFAGLGFVDRIGGGVLGAAEGAVMVALGVFIATLVLGRTDPLLAGSHSLAALDAVETWVTGKPPAPPRAEAAPEARPVPKSAKR
jgi:membrane protein required for colicin V production